MQNWSEKRLLRFHPDNCKCMKIGTFYISLFQYRLKENQKDIDFTDAEEDTEVIMDNKLAFENIFVGR